MRLWSLHPRYLDAKGLVALWREGLLAQAVLTGRMQGYRQHPQLVRFRQSSAPQTYIAAYLWSVLEEAVRRGYHFDASKIDSRGTVAPLQVTQGQIAYEWGHLSHKLKARAAVWFYGFDGGKQEPPHPLFEIVSGGIAQWETVSAPSIS